MISINVCYTLMIVRQRCWLSMLRTVLLSSLISFKWPLNCYLLASATRCFHLTITLHKFANLLSILLRNISGIVQKVFKFPAANILVYTFYFVSSELDNIVILCFMVSPRTYYSVCNNMFWFLQLGLSPCWENESTLCHCFFSYFGCLLSSVLNLKCYFLHIRQCKTWLLTT